jgi:hypothetical protein
MVDRAAINDALERPQLATVGQLCAERPLHFALAGENCRTVASRLARDRLERLPVVRDEASLQLVGLVARSDLVQPTLIHFEEEEKKERLMGLPWRSEP